MALRNNSCLMPPNIRLVMLILALFLVPIVSASSDWQTFGKSNMHEGFQDPTFLGAFDVVGIFSTKSGGADFSPLSADLDNDGVPEIISSNGNYMQIRYIDSEGVIKLENEYNFGSSQSTMGWMGDIDDDDLIEYVVVNGINISVIDYNGTDFNESCDVDVGNIRTGVSCFEASGTFGCYFGDDSGNVTQFNPNTCGFVDINYTALGTDIFNTQHDIDYPPAIADIDNDGNYEAIFIADGNADGKEGIIVIDLLSDLYDTGFSVDGRYDNVGTQDSVDIHGLLISNVDGAGTKEICYSFVDYEHGAGGSITGEDGELQCQKSDGSIFITRTLVILDSATSAHPSISNPVMANVVGGGQREICAVGVDRGADINNFRIKCLDEDGDIVADTGDLLNFSDTYLSFDGSGREWNLKISSADMNGDGLEDIVTSNSIWFSDGLGNFTNLNYSNNNMYQSHVIPVDANGDGSLDVIGLNGSQIFIASSNFSNSPPTLNGREFGKNFQMPLCLDTSITFTAKECGDHPCHYTNDAPADTERLVSTCGINSSETFNGTYHLSQPELSCTYNSIGSYAVEIFLEDLSNVGDTSQSISSSVIVINGTSGIDCNLPASFSTLIGDNSSIIGSDPDVTSEDDIKEAIEIFTMQSQFMKNLLVLIFSITFLYGIVKYAGGKIPPIVYVIAIFMLWVVFALLGLLPWIYVIIFAIVAFALAGISFALGNGD